MKRKLTYSIVINLSLAFLGCVEEVEINANLKAAINIEEVLVVEATITDEFINQEVLLSRGSSFANDSVVVYEPNASISVVDDLGATFLFNYISDGRYLSSEPFAAQSGRSYKLFITTGEGEAYESEPVISAGVSSIDNIYAERITSDNGVEGMAIFVDSSNPSGEFNNYRYTYEETYKIIAPSWAPFEFILLNEFEYDIAPREQEERICFKTVDSNSIILACYLENGDNLEKQLVRFIGKNNFIISHRYSILITQFAHSRIGYDFYRVLDSFSSNEDLLSEEQPGYIEGTVITVNNERKVIGFFDVVSIDQKRLFFNYEDFFSNEPLPDYPFNCRIFSPSTDDGIFAGLVEYVGENENPGTGEAPIFVTTRACGDCTALGSNVVPDFWTEE